MGNNDFSYLFRSGHSLSSAPSAGESQLEPNVEQVEQEQQGSIAVSATKAAGATMIARAIVAVGAAGATTGRI